MQSNGTNLNSIGGEKMELNNEYWLVVWNKVTGDFRIALLRGNTNNPEEIIAEFSIKNPKYKVIHIGDGNLPPKTYRSLEYIY